LIGKGEGERGTSAKLETRFGGGGGKNPPEASVCKVAFEGESWVRRRWAKRHADESGPNQWLKEGGFEKKKGPAVGKTRWTLSGGLWPRRN